uniref:NADH dehydrogenase subunit 4L n=1 Tax=Eupolyphaga nigrinotum TaxID=2972403 RepID=UPI002E799C9E|nr:NADH dehydrogenase subunit 4L [Eupolyphaga nigrinotum]WPM91825.1 NADH dehydrogenase subunit 4L [Eupolyphaga nigrinotum]
MLMLYLFFLFFSGVWVFCFSRKHLLIVLLSLEFLVLSLYFCLCIYLNSFNYELYFSVVFLTFSVCEGALGLSILVSLVRGYGNDYFQSFSLLQC